MGWSQGIAAELPAVQATLVVHATDLATNPIPRELTGKFCEHLGANIYNGMDAQILRNPTFADYPVWSGQMTPDGITAFDFEKEKLETELRRQASRAGWPDSEIASMFAARNEGLACFWSRAGQHDDVQVSPDTGPHGGRAQRLELKKGAGLKQWTWLPLHRTRQYQFEILARSPNLGSLHLALAARDAQKPCVETAVSGLSTEWHKLSGELTVPEDAPRETSYCLTLSTESAGQVVLAHFFLRPADHVNGADPDVIRLLKEARLPLLRWPGGNFVSAYHWEDGIGPVESRPTKPNYAWGGVEPNTFGTDEFIAFCRAVGCEPMICINAGTGTPEEAARWIEYCNGAASSPMGARRAANGHRQPFKVRHWEVGNELWGHWQAHWTTAAGYVDRYQRFARAMLKSDPHIELHACGAPAMWGKNWNDTLIGGTGAQLHSITDHPLIGGNVARTTQPLDVLRDFMLVPDVLSRKWTDLRRDLLAGGIAEPRLAVTELQMFAHLSGPVAAAGENEPLTRDKLVNPGTLAEALYDTLIFHWAARMQPFVELIAHSATVNHGGGLRKERERVYANPCHYANALFAQFAGARVVRTELQSPVERAPLVLPDVKSAASSEPSYSAVAALAALTAQKELLISIVNRGSGAPAEVQIKLEDFAAREQAQVTTISGEAPWSANTLEKPQLVKPETSRIEIRERALKLVLPPYSVVQVTILPR